VGVNARHANSKLLNLPKNKRLCFNAVNFQVIVLNEDALATGSV